MRGKIRIGASLAAIVLTCFPGDGNAQTRIVLGTLSCSIMRPATSKGNLIRCTFEKVKPFHLEDALKEKQLKETVANDAAAKKGVAKEAAAKKGAAKEAALKEEPTLAGVDIYSGAIPTLDLQVDTGDNFMTWTVYGPKELAPKGLVGSYKRKENTTVPIGDDVVNKLGALGGNALIGSQGLALQPSAMTYEPLPINAKFNLAVGVTTLELH
jgi:hypothetical protein